MLANNLGFIYNLFKAKVANPFVLSVNYINFASNYNKTYLHIEEL